MFPDLLKGDGIGKASLLTCGIEELCPNKFQPRKDFDDRAQKRLVASIKRSGILQPIIVRTAGTGYEIIAGERRWRAAQEAGLKDVPVIVRTAEDVEVAELSLIENIQREALNPIEEAEAYQTLSSRFGLSQDDISARVGKDRSTIANTIRLLKLPGDARTAIIKKTITPGHARALLALTSGTEQIRALDLIIRKNLSVREAEHLVHKLNKVSPEKSVPKKDHTMRDLEETLTKRFRTRVRIRQGKKSGSLELSFTTVEDLTRIVGILLQEKV
jgi:ParB family transcriptional regulator, chromosome partitioning protein